MCVRLWSLNSTLLAEKNPLHAEQNIESNDNTEWQTMTKARAVARNWWESCLLNHCTNLTFLTLVDLSLLLSSFILGRFTRSFFCCGSEVKEPKLKIPEISKSKSIQLLKSFRPRHSMIWSIAMVAIAEFRIGLTGGGQILKLLVHVSKEF